MPSDTVPDAANDPMRQLLDGPPDPTRRLRPRHWLGIGLLTATVVVAAFLLPPVISPAPQQPSLGATAQQTRTPTDSPDPTGTATVTASASGPTGPATTPGGTTATAGGGVFRPLNVQAEDPTNTLSGGAGVAVCDTCDGGARVRYLGGTAALTVHLNIPTAGTRAVTVEYECDGDRKLDVSINGGPAIVTTTSGTSWEVPQFYHFATDIPAGTVTMTFYNLSGPAPDIDKVTVS